LRWSSRAAVSFAPWYARFRSIAASVIIGARQPAAQ
jgi:hypothetical protein